MRRLLATAGLLSAMAVSAAGATALMPPYKDDRSDAGALISSYYNALARKEFARAWSYHGDDKPAADFDSFEAESMDISAIDLVIGMVEGEGAAGSAFYKVPVAVRITHDDGSEDVLAGCHVTRLANPQIQGVPFRPMYIMRSSLAPASGPLEDAVPADCPDF